MFSGSPRPPDRSRNLHSGPGQINLLTFIRKGTLLDIMKYPRLRMKTLLMYFNWFTSSFILYGIALNWQALTGGLFLNFAIAAALDFPAKLLALVSLVWLGRRLPYISLTALAGFCFIISLFIER